MAYAFELPDQPFRLAAYLWRYRGRFWVQAAGGILYNTVIVAGPIVLGKMLDAASAMERDGYSRQGMGRLTLFALLFVGVTVFFQFARYVKRWYIRDMSNRIACDMRAGLLASVLDRPMEEVERESVGDLMARTVGDVNQIVGTMQTTINEGWDTWLLMVSYFVVLMVYDWRLTLLCSIPIPIALYVAESARHPLYRFSTGARRAASVVNSHLQRTLSGIAILRLFGREEAERQRLQEFSIDQMRWNIRTALLQIGIMPIYASLASLGVIGVIGLGGQRVLGGDWSLGQFTSYLIMFMAMAARTQVAARVLNQFHAARASWDRVKEKLRAPEAREVAAEGGGRVGGPSSTPAPALAVAGSTVRPGVALPRDGRFEPGDGRGAAATYLSPAGHVRASGLSFTYPGANQDALSGVAFEAQPGALVAITGPVGSGKSALAAVLTGLYPYQGSLRVDGRELRHLTSSERTAAIAYSGQDAFIFATTIAENVVLREHPLPEEDERLDRVLHAVALSEDLALFGDGIATRVGERGVRVSGGQRQRIALARALYSDCLVVVLDDPFSAVDIGTERRAIERLREAVRGRTVFLLSHRLAAFPQADLVLVLDRGRVIEQGTHQSLMAQGGVYSRIYAAQTWLERETHGQE